MSTTLTQSIEHILPEDLRAHYSVITAELEPLLTASSYLQAIARIDMILQGIPANQDNRLLRAAFLAKRGEIYLEGDYNEEAEEDLRHAVHNGIKTPEIFAALGWTHYHMDKSDKAREWFDRAIAHNADDESALMGRALVLQELDELDDAKKDLTKALQNATKRAELYAMRSDVHARMGDIEAAEKDIKSARDADPMDRDAMVAHARIMTAKGKPQLALDMVQKALAGQKEPGLEELLLRSHLRLITGELEPARKDAQQATEAFDDEAFAFVQLAQIQLSNGEVDKALKSAERAVALDDELPDAYLVRGAVRRLMGEQEGSQRDLEKASQTQPELPIFLFGAAYTVMDTSDFHADLFAKLKEHEPESMQSAPEPAAPASGGANPFGGFPGMGGGFPGMGGMDPMKMMSQMFDDEGNIRPAFKPIVRMALKNAPSILKNMPSGMLKNMGGVDKEMLENVDLSNLSSDQLEAQMKQMYKMMKSGEDPKEMMNKAREQYEKDKK